jgi:ABC-type phosphate transport system, ATPase component
LFLFNYVSFFSDQADPTDIGFKLGMVFQKPIPFPKTFFENVAFGPKINGFPSSEIEGIVDSSLKQAALWDEFKDRLQDNGLVLSGGQQQRLCIARALAVIPDIILMDEPASALDPVSTSKLEDLVKELSKNVTIIIVTHNMQQATRICDYAAVMMAGEARIGELIEYGTNDSVFGIPKDKRTEDYVTGRIG